MFSAESDLEGVAARVDDEEEAFKRLLEESCEQTLAAGDASPPPPSLDFGEDDMLGLDHDSSEGEHGTAFGEEKFKHLLEEMQQNVALEDRSDSSAGRGMCLRQGVGRVRHLETRYLWVQERVGEGHLKISSVPGDRNPADILTKSVTGVLLKKHLRALNVEMRESSLSHKKVLKGTVATLHYQGLRQSRS